MKIAVLLPVKNEESTIASVLKEITTSLEGYSLSYIIVSDSTDKTDEYVGNIPNITLLRGNGRGLGAAIKIGLNYIKNIKTDLVFIFDSDGQTDYSEAIYFLREYERLKPDLIIASRFKKSDLIEYKYQHTNKLGVMLLTKYLRLMTGLNITDSHGGIRLLTKKLVDNLKIYGNHTYVQEMIIDAHFKKFKIIELDSKWKQRKYGTSRVVASKYIYIKRTLPYLIHRFLRHKVLGR